MKKMLLVLAHPDDESFMVGATIARYAKLGWDIDLFCATRGEAGGSGEIRQKEVEKAASLLGISTITFMGYMDGSLKREPPGGLEDEIFQKMVEVIPDIVITFDTLGVSNHPDHIRMCFATTYAFQKYAKRIDEDLAGTKEYTPQNAPKLYYACIPESVVSYLKKKNVLPEVSFDKPWLGTEDKLVTTVIPTKGFEMIKKRALQEHKTQKDDVDRFFSLPKNPLMKQEYFILRMHGTREVFMGNNDRVVSKL